MLFEVGCYLGEAEGLEWWEGRVSIGTRYILLSIIHQALVVREFNHHLQGTLILSHAGLLSSPQS
jgi:hypothetical protein